MILSKTLSTKSFAVYGLGVTGLSVLNCLKKSKVKNFYLWDDDKTKRNSIKTKPNIKDFLKQIPEYVDQIYLIDDCCPLKTGKIVEENISNFKNSRLLIFDFMYGR